MSGEAWLYLLAVLINAVNLFLQVFFTIMYSDLEWYVVAALFPPPRRACLLPPWRVGRRKCRCGVGDVVDRRREDRG